MGIAGNIVLESLKHKNETKEKENVSTRVGRDRKRRKRSMDEEGRVVLERVKYTNES